MKFSVLGLGLLYSVWMPFAQAQDMAAVSTTVVGSQFAYTVQAGDYLTRIGARFGIAPTVLARMNGIKYNALIYPGQVLQIDNRHIVPETLQTGIVINLPQRMLYYFQAGSVLVYFPVGLGRPDWPTPMGHFRALALVENKTWHVPKSIQEEMRRESQVVQTEVPPGPDNPLGKYWIGLSLPGIGIHGTIAPASIYHFQSHGCIRLHPDDIELLFQLVHKGQAGQIIYAPVLLARQADGHIVLEVNKDIYRHGLDAMTSVENAVQYQGWQGMLDWNKVQEVIRLQDGLARDVSLPGTGIGVTD